MKTELGNIDCFSSYRGVKFCVVAKVRVKMREGGGGRKVGLCALAIRITWRQGFSPGIGVIDPRKISVMSVRASGDFHQSENILRKCSINQLEILNIVRKSDLTNKTVAVKTK